MKTCPSAFPIGSALRRLLRRALAACKRKASDLYAGCGIADYNGETGEVSLEWIQAFVYEPLRRRRGFTGRDVRRVPTRR